MLCILWEKGTFSVVVLIVLTQANRLQVNTELNEADMIT